MSKSMTDAEREQLIVACGLSLVEAMNNGDRHTAANWMQAQMLHIACRSPAQKARMTAAIEQAISDGNDYFNTQGAIDGARMAA